MDIPPEHTQKPQPDWELCEHLRLTQPGVNDPINPDSEIVKILAGIPKVMAEPTTASASAFLQPVTFAKRRHRGR